MSVKHFDYCREMKIKAKELLPKIKNKLPPWDKLNEKDLNRFIVDLELICKSVNGAVKYILPDNGLTLGDETFSNLQDTRLELPYQSMVLEYRDFPINKDLGITYTKSILLIKSDVDVIKLYKVVGVVYGDDLVTVGWIPTFNVAIRKDRPFERNSDGSVSLNVLYIEGDTEAELNSIPISHTLDVFLDFLNSLAHPGIRIFKSNANVPTVKSKSGKKKKVKTSIPYDDYHVVTIDVPPITYVNDNKGTVTERCSPRQHTRAAHWRHYKSGKKVRIEDMVINADNKSKVEKVYKLRNREGGININTR